jgi:hypothetical protein
VDTGPAATAASRPRLASGAQALLAHDRVVLVGLLLIAAATRLPGLATRGRWEGDQGDELMTLWRWIHDGVVPLLGTPAANNAFHHGAGWYYYLLGPVAFAAGADPGALVWVMAAFGIATVAVTWWLAFEVGGRLAGLIAGLFMAISPAGIEASTFLWNANLVPCFAGLAVASAWHAYATRRPNWWVAALASAGMVLQLHLLGAILLPAIVALLALDLRRARNDDRADLAGGSDRSRRLLVAGLVGAGLVVALFLPWLLSELQTGFQETGRLLDYLRGSAVVEGVTLSPPARLLLIVLRVIGWPLVGLITDVPIAATVGAALVIGLATWRALRAPREEAIAVRWLAGTVAWSSLALTFAAPTLQSVVPGLPNDHYHAFLDPIVIVLLAVGAAGLARGREAAGEREMLASTEVPTNTAPPSRSDLPDPAKSPAPGVTSERARTSAASAGTVNAIGRIVGALVAIGVVALVAVAINRWPPAVDPNGGWPAARAAGARIVEAAGQAPTAFLGLPRFETPDGVAFPFVYAGGNVVAEPGSAQSIVVPCDHLFDQVVGAPCGGAAEDRLIQDLVAGRVNPFLKAGGPPYPALGQVPELLVRFDLSPRTSVSIYRRR